MKEIKKQILKEKDLTVITVHGDLTSKSIIDILNDFYKSEITLNLLFDFTHADLPIVNEADVNKVIAVAKEYGHLRKGGKTAIVVSQDAIYGISRMYEILSELAGHKIQHLVTRSIDEAINWVER